MTAVHESSIALTAQFANDLTSPATEAVACYLCGTTHATPFVDAEDDLTGRPGSFHFVRCAGCGLAYQTPRIPLQRIADYYDDDYIAHRRTRDWGLLAPLFARAMNRLDADKDALVARYVALTRASDVLDVGCGTGSFLARLRSRYGASVAGVDFKDLSASPSLAGAEFHCSLFYEAPLAPDRFDLVTM
jgi:hypothetical protein